MMLLCARWTPVHSVVAVVLSTLYSAVAAHQLELSVGCSNITTNMAVKSLGPDGEGPHYSLNNSASCEAKCCAYHDCTAWTFTPTPRSYCPDGCCFLKKASQSTVGKGLIVDTGYTSGCVGFKCVPPPSPSPSPSPYPPLPFPYVHPEYMIDRMFAKINDTTLRDPTTALFDPITNTWHVYCTHVSGKTGQGGYPGVIWHWFLRSADLFDTTVAWQDGGMALNASYIDGRFDAFGVFTPGAIRDCDTTDNKSCKWYLFYGGIPSSDPAHRENIGLATSDSPFGPFVRYGIDPVFNYLDATTNWCKDIGSTPARVDEIKATVMPNRGGYYKVFLVKCACENRAALPVMYAPVNNYTWGPPYKAFTKEGMIPHPLFPLNETCSKLGYEEPTLYTGPDGYLHFQGHDHGACRYGDYSHYISRNHSLWTFEQAPPFQPKAFEPVPVPVSGDGIFGGEIYPKWIDFPDAAYLAFMNVTWIWSNATTLPEV